MGACQAASTRGVGAHAHISVVSLLPAELKPDAALTLAVTPTLALFLTLTLSLSLSLTLAVTLALALTLTLTLALALAQALTLTLTLTPNLAAELKPDPAARDAVVPCARLSSLVTPLVYLHMHIAHAHAHAHAHACDNT